jgi:hypothetical protein
MKSVTNPKESIHGNEEAHGRQEEGGEEKILEEARSGPFTHHPPAAIAPV